MSGVKRSKDRSRSGRFLDVYYRAIIVGFLLALGAASAMVLVQLRTKGVIQVSFAQTGGTLESRASVSPNPINSLSDKLQQKETALTQKEVELQHKESSLAEIIATNEARVLAYLLSVSGALFLLILLNFFLDYKRSLKLRQDSQMKL